MAISVVVCRPVMAEMVEDEQTTKVAPSTQAALAQRLPPSDRANLILGPLLAAPTWMAMAAVAATLSEPMRHLRWSWSLADDRQHTPSAPPAPLDC